MRFIWSRKYHCHYSLSKYLLNPNIRDVLEFMILSLFTLGTYISTNKVIQWQTEKKEQLHLIAGKGRNNLNTRMQLDKGTYILTGQILNQNFQETGRGCRGTFASIK